MDRYIPTIGIYEECNMSPPAQNSGDRICATYSRPANLVGKNCCADWQKAATGAQCAPAKNSDVFASADANNSNGTSTASFFVNLRQGRSDQGSSPCSTPSRSPSP